MRRALLTLSLLATTTSAGNASAAEVTVPTDPITEAMCLSAPASATVSGASINMPASTPKGAWLRSPARPANKPNKWYTAPNCADRFIADFIVTSQSKITDPTTPYIPPPGHFKVFSAVGTADGVFGEHNTLGNGISIDKVDPGGECPTTGSKDVIKECRKSLCYRLMKRELQAWKKPGETTWTMITSGRIFYEYSSDSNSCRPSLYFLPQVHYDESKVVGPGSTTQGQKDSYRTLPPAGKSATYRFVVEVGLSKDRVWMIDPNTQKPKAILSASDRIERQLSVEAILEPWSF